LVPIFLILLWILAVMDAFRAQLDELLGKDRNLLPTEKPKTPTSFADPAVCRYFICGTETLNFLGVVP
jgi:hypothetical protein